MKRLLRSFLILALLPTVTLSFYSPGWTQERWAKEDPVTDQYTMADVLLARPIGFAAGIIGTGVFLLSLPFTIPTRSVDEAAQRFVVKPFKFSFERKFPDDDM